mmetsp:Transcript_61727/g.175313  ORF Transcript_61727/g.175313 Transcript_61727/m.175313 type:complete len:256 (-) Transcript_61727:218-985(-)
MRPPMMKPSLGRLLKFEQSEFTSSRAESWLTRLEGPASCEVPVSTATRQSWHSSCLVPLIVMSSILTSQYPALPVTGTQKSLEAMCSCLTSPKVISEVSLSESERKTEKMGRFSSAAVTSLLIMLKELPWDMLGRARPRTPSKANDAKGCELSSVEAMKAPSEHAAPTQMTSLKQRPVMCPVPKVMVIPSVSAPWYTSWPSQLTCFTVDDLCSWNWLCIVQALLPQPSPGTMRLPLPVSNTTEKLWCGVPSVSSP